MSEHNAHMISRPQDCNLPKPCRLSFPPEAQAEAVDSAVSALMNATQPWTRSEYKALIEEVFHAGVTSVTHERG